MAPLPKRRHSSRRQSKRTRALKVTRVTLTSCPQCHELKQPHRVCAKCGFYDQKAIIITKAASAHTHS